LRCQPLRLVHVLSRCMGPSSPTHFCEGKQTDSDARLARNDAFHRLNRLAWPGSSPTTASIRWWWRQLPRAAAAAAVWQDFLPPRRDVEPARACMAWCAAKLRWGALLAELGSLPSWARSTRDRSHDSPDQFNSSSWRGGLLPASPPAHHVVGR